MQKPRGSCNRSLSISVTELLLSFPIERFFFFSSYLLKNIVFLFQEMPVNYCFSDNIYITTVTSSLYLIFRIQSPNLFFLFLDSLICCLLEKCEGIFGLISPEPQSHVLSEIIFLLSVWTRLFLMPFQRDYPSSSSVY